MSDFETAIINASHSSFPTIPIAGCFFHLGKNVYRHVQSSKLQTDYENQEDDTIRRQTHMLLALAFVPVPDVVDAFEELYQTIDPRLKPVFDYFDDTYIRGRQIRGRTQCTPPLYPISLWNQYEATLNGLHRTNNVSEGWHNRFNLLVNKSHPDLCSFLGTIKKEEGDVNTLIVEVGLGKRVRAGKRRKYSSLETRLKNVCDNYDDYKVDTRVMEYLHNVGCNIYLA